MHLGHYFLMLALGIGVLRAADDDKSSATGLLDDSAPFSFASEDLTLLAPDINTKSKGWLGVGIQELDLLARALEESKGVRITDVAPDAPAQLAGVRKGDLLTHWNEMPVSSATALQEHLAALKIGEEVVLKVLRNDSSHSLNVKATDRETYRWKDFWEPNLPNFKASDDLDILFDEHADSLETLKRRFEELEAEAAQSEKPKSKS